MSNNDLIWQWHESKQALDEMKKTEMDLRAQVVKAMGDGRHNLGHGAVLTVSTPERIAVDSTMAASMDGGPWRVKYDLDKSKYNRLSDNEKAAYNTAITTKPGAPVVKFEIKGD